MPIKSNLKDLTPSKDRYTRKFQLLSGGRINGEFFPGGQITVYPWDFQVDEWISARTRKGLIKGKTMLFQVLPKVCNLNGCPVEKFVWSEVMMVLMLSRSVLRNDELKISHSCPSCQNDAEDTVKIPDQLEKIGEKGADWPGYDEFTLPDSADVVRVRPITAGEEMRILDRSENDREKICSDDMARVISGIVSVNGGVADTPSELLTLIKAYSPKDVECLVEQFNKAQPQLSQVLHMQCDSCGNKYDYILSLNQDFFRTSSEARIGKPLQKANDPSVQKPWSPVSPQ
jgi:hypothetical protein